VIEVIIADDQGMVRSGLRSLLDAEEDINVIAEAEDGDVALELILRLRPEVALMDIRMPGLDGIAATKKIIEAGVPTRIIALTTFDLDEYVFGALRAGASGFLLKDAPADDLVAAIRIIAEGEALLAPAVTRRVIDAFIRASPEEDRGAAGPPTLTARELEVLRLIARGLSNTEIAQALVLSKATVKTHVSNVLAKLNARDRVHAVISAYECGLVLPRKNT
jgi:DNA-binding NarL/FixJ family response regulator